MPELLDQLDPESVRKLCRADLTSADLPDSTVNLPVYTQPALGELLQMDPAAASREGADLMHVASALNRLVAAHLLPAVPMVTAEKFEDGDYTLQKVDVERRAAELRRQARDEIALLDGAAEPHGAGTPPAFIVVN